MKEFNGKEYEKCELCPHGCKVDRTEGKTGVCGVSDRLKVARAALHHWEEPCISGKRGSGTVFFSGCSLHCVYCQNESIANGTAGIEIGGERLSEIFLELQDKKANNINLVTPGQYLPHIIKAVERARAEGLVLPIVYNTGGYETVDAIRSLEGIVDVYLPDFKYWSEEVARRYSHAPDYPARAKAAIEEMVRQQPVPVFSEEKDGENELITQGVIVRHLLLPGQLMEAKKIVRYLYETYGNQIYLSLMSQFTPLENVRDYPELQCKVRTKTYKKLVDFALNLGVEQGFLQEGDVAEESFIPNFEGEGVLHP